MTSDALAETIYADGEALNSSILGTSLISYTDQNGDAQVPSTVNGTQRGKYVFSVYDSGATTGADNASIAGNTDVRTTLTAYVVGEVPTVTYDGAAVTSSLNPTFETSKGEGFDPSLVEAYLASGDDVPVSVTVTKDGEVVTSYDEPGEYVVSLEVATPANCAYGYTGSFKFNVVTKTINASRLKTYVTVDGKALSSDVTYTGEPVVPTVVVKEGSKVLDSADYVVTYYVGGTETAVESMVDCGSYDVVVSFPGTGITPEKVNFSITKATVLSAKATQDVYAYTGDVIKPDFVGYTGANLDGMSVDLPNDGVGAVYYAATWSDRLERYVVDLSNPISAASLKAEGTYVARLNVNSNNKNFQGTVAQTEVFEISKTAGFADVDASAWYASVVYKAKELGYVNGIGGTDLYAPNTEITRGDVACILFNMAGGDNAMGDYQYDESTGWVTGFGDVDGHAYYAQAIAWAHASGVVNGSNGQFRPDDKITREEFACMLANFARSKGEDVSASEGALDGVSDASGVSAWAEANVAWAVENGVMGNGGFVNAGANITRAEVAAMAVNYQPEKL